MKINSKVYDVLRDLAQVYVPGLGALYFALAGIWHLPAAEQVVGTTIAIDTFLGVILKLSTSTYNNTLTELGGKIAGTIMLEGSQVRISSIDVNALQTKPELTFSVVKTPSPDPDLAGETVPQALQPPSNPATTA